ncbi:MAG: prepilin peptidase [Alphaproteobacteria bacterium]|nr:prepilin peptidase [Alphaproteobacteria bacterium]
MIYILEGFIIGLLIPYMARRFAKFMPATPAYALYRLVAPHKIPLRSNPKQKALKKAYLWRSLMAGGLGALLAWAILFRFGEIECFWYMGFSLTLLLLAEIDGRTFLLPDILTVPLLICGFVFASVSGGLTPFESAISALIGYILPTFAALIMLSYDKEAFGGGDIKFLSAVGAWLGINGLLYTILLSCFLFGIYALIAKKRSGAFGPSIAGAAIIILLFGL